MIFTKLEIVAMHEAEFEAWEKLLSSLSTAQITEPLLPDGLSVKDKVSHLTAWQARTIARFEAVLHNHAPQFPQWAVDLDEEESMETVDRANAWILETHRHQPWADVYREWRKGFLHFLEMLRAIPDSEFRPGGKLEWAAEYQPLDGNAGSYDYHHAEHRVELEDWIHKLKAP